LLARQYGAALDDRGRQYVRFMTGGAQRMEMLVKDLLVYTKSASSEGEPKEPVNAGDALSTALSNLAEMIRETQAEVSCGALPTLRISEIHLEQLFQNLIGNAIKYRKDSEPPRIE